MFVGCHVSIRHGFLDAARTAHRIGAGAYQYFPKNPRSLALKEPNRDDAEACRQFCREHGILSIAHAPYPTNIALSEPDKREMVRRSILNDLEIAEACGSVGLVVHFGIYKGRDTLQGYKNILQLLNDVLAEWSGAALILLENQAGEGAMMGTTLEELVQIRQLCRAPEKIAFCLDTCHIFASGVWNGHNWSELLDKGGQLGYFQHLRAVHLNDSMYPSGSLKDRHANIGLGHIGDKALTEFLRSTAVRGIPVVLETPTPANGSHRDEILRVQELAAISNRK